MNHGDPRQTVKAAVRRLMRFQGVKVYTPAFDTRTEPYAAVTRRSGVRSVGLS